MCVSKYLSNAKRGEKSVSVLLRTRTMSLLVVLSVVSLRIEIRWSWRRPGCGFQRVAVCLRVTEATRKLDEAN